MRLRNADWAPGEARCHWASSASVASSLPASEPVAGYTIELFYP